MEVPRDRLQLRDSEDISPPYLVPELYQCSPVVHVRGYLPHAEIDIEIDGSVVVNKFPGGMPLPDGVLVPVGGKLSAGQVVRARQHAKGVMSDWSAPLTVRDHLKDYPAGPPRPEINPAPVYQCGSRTGIRNLLGGSNVWITADGTEVGRHEGAKQHQGVNVAPDYSKTQTQTAVAWSDMCGDPSPPSAAETTQFRAPPLNAPTVKDPIPGSPQLELDEIANGARFEVKRGTAGSSIGTFSSWGGLTYITLLTPAGDGEPFSVEQWLCPGDPRSPPGTATGQPCSALGAPTVHPPQAGDTRIVLLTFDPNATIKVFVNGSKVGEGGGPEVNFFPSTPPIKHGDTVHVVQDVGQCKGAWAQEIRVSCVSPPVHANPASLNLFPIGFKAYDIGRVPIGAKTHKVAGTVYYPADADGTSTPFNSRLGALGPTPIVFLVHGRHGGTTSHLGYDYFQKQLARMGLVAVSVDCNESDAWGGWADNIADRAEILFKSIAHFQALTAGGDPVFGGRIDFDRTGLMGHSRGGDAVVTAAEIISLPGVRIRGVLALAPVNSGASSGAPSGYTGFLTILPAFDGDVVELSGAQFYDRARTEFRSQIFMHGANHNFFNREWTNDDANGLLPLVSRQAHEAVLSAYGCAFFRNVLFGHATRDFLMGKAIPWGVDFSLIHLSFGLPGGTKVVDDFDDGGTIATNVLGRPNTLSGLTADEHDFSRSGASRFNASFFGATVGMVAVAGEPGGMFRTELDSPVDLTGREVWVRAAEVYVGPGVPPSPTGFELGIETRSGAVTWVDVDGVGGLPRPQDRRAHDIPKKGSDLSKTMPKTFRFPAGCLGASPQDHVVALLLRLNRPGRRPLAFDDIEIV
jgi:dienelactone hydrolase